MNSRRTLANAVAVALATVALLLYGISALLSEALFPTSYPLFIDVPIAAGLQENKEVAYNGFPVGRVATAQLSDEGVRLRLEMDADARIPVTVAAVILRRSAIGEQALDLRPPPASGSAAPVYAAGDTITPTSLTLPPDISEFFAVAADVFGPIDPQTAGTVVAELADAVAGRRQDIVAIMRDSAEFSAQIADNADAYTQLFASSRIVNAQLAAHRETLARLITEMADATAILTEVRGDFQGLLADGPPVLGQVSELIGRSQANLSCDIAYLADINTYLAEPDRLFDASEALRQNQFFFRGVRSYNVPDSQNRFWQRVLLLTPQEPPADNYGPDKRPIRDVLPGGACSSPFGEGAPAATQAGYSTRVSGLPVIPPDDARAMAVRRPPGSAVIPGATNAAPGAAPGVTPAPSLPATGGGGATSVLGALLLGSVYIGMRQRGRLDGHG